MYCIDTKCAVDVSQKEAPGRPLPHTVARGVPRFQPTLQAHFCSMQVAQEEERSGRRPRSLPPAVPRDVRQPPGE